MGKLRNSAAWMEGSFAALVPFFVFAITVEGDKVAGREDELGEYADNGENIDVVDEPKQRAEKGGETDSGSVADVNGDGINNDGGHG